MYIWCYINTSNNSNKVGHLPRPSRTTTPAAIGIANA